MAGNLDQTRMIRPILITDDNFTSSNVVETDEALWSSSTSYSVDDLVMLTTDYHKIYKCAVANSNQNPPDNIYDGTTDPVTGYWIEVGSTNRWKMYDEKARSYTVNADTIVSEITPNELFNAVAIINVDAETANVTVTADSVEVYSRDVDFQDLTEITDYYPWFFEPIVRKENAVFLDLPAYANGIIKITVDKTGDDASLGGFIVGTQKVLGDSIYGTTFSIKDYSLKTTDEETGSSVITEGSFSKIVDYSLTMYTSKINDVYSELSKQRAKPVVYIGDEGLTETITYGFYRDFSIVMSDYTTSNCSLRVEELN